MFGFGTNISLTFNYDQPLIDQTTITLSRLSNKFVLRGGGEGYLDQFGYDRVEREATLPTVVETAMGQIVLKAPISGIKSQFGIKLQQLTLAEYNLIQNMIAAQRKTGKLIRLDDRILPFVEYGTRTRVVAPSSGSPVTSGGFVSYYTSFLIWIPLITRRQYEGDGRGQLEFDAFEYGEPLAP